MRCQGCLTELLTTNMPGGHELRCAVCGNLFSVDSARAISSGHRGAWWSLGLGGLSLLVLSGSIVLLFVEPGGRIVALSALAFALGFPAVYFGVRALLRQKYQRSDKKTLLAAVAGTLLGAIFGIFTGGIFTLFGLMIIAIVWSEETAEGLTASLPASQKLFRFELPAEPPIQPWGVRSTPFVFSDVDYRDHEKENSSSVWMEVQRFPKWVTANRGQFIGMLRNEIYAWIRGSNLSPSSDETLKWKIIGEDREVTRIAWQLTHNADAEIRTQAVQYYSLFNEGAKTYGIVLAHRPEKSNLDEAAIRKIFESFEPVSE